MAPFTITHQGVPIGAVELDVGQERAAVAVMPFPAYEAIRPIVRASSRALRAVAGNATGAEGGSQDALERAAALGKVLELRDTVGELVPTDFIELTEWPGEDPEVRAWIGIRGVPAAKPARRPDRKGKGPESAPPAA